MSGKPGRSGRKSSRADLCVTSPDALDGIPVLPELRATGQGFIDFVLRTNKGKLFPEDAIAVNLAAATYERWLIEYRKIQKTGAFEIGEFGKKLKPEAKRERELARDLLSLLKCLRMTVDSHGVPVSPDRKSEAVNVTPFSDDLGEAL